MDNQDKKPISKEDKEKLINDLKETFKDLGVIGKKILNPIIEFIGNKYETLDKGKKDEISNFVKESKNTGEKGINKIRELIGIIKK